MKLIFQNFEDSYRPLVEVKSAMTISSYAYWSADGRSHLIVLTQVEWFLGCFPCPKQAISLCSGKSSSGLLFSLSFEHEVKSRSR